MSCPNFIRDGRIIWLGVPKIGTPAYWSPGTNYKLGDTVIPRPDFVIPSGEENTMFQVVGFCGKTSNTAPVFPIVLGNTVTDNEIVWTCRSPTDDPAQIPKSEYYVIDRTTIVS